MGAGFVKVAADLDSNPKIRRAGRAAREVFLFVLRRTNLQERDGRCSLSNVEPWYLADQLMMDESEAAQGVQRAIAAGLIAIDAGHVVVCGWDDEWAKRPAEGAERTERWRNKRKSDSELAPSPNVTVTNRDAASVTERHITSPVTTSDGANVSKSHGDESDGSDQIRLDQIRVDHRESALSAPTPQSPTTDSPVAPKTKGARASRERLQAMPAGWAPRGDELALAKTLGVDPTREGAAFKDHHSAKGSRFVDWDAAFRTWLRNAVKFNRSSSGGSRGGPSFFDIIDAMPATARPEDRQ
jgi:hypothetical protein